MIIKAAIDRPALLSFYGASKGTEFFLCKNTLHMRPVSSIRLPEV